MSKYFNFYHYGLIEFSTKSIKLVREQIVSLFINEFNLDKNSSIIDIGVSKEEHESSNTFEKIYPYTKNITAVSEIDCKEIEKIYDGLKFVKADGKNLPFSNQTFDFAYSHAVIEHVGDFENQVKFIKELLRVSRKGIFITTPNRWHPIEFHTGLPLFHFFPQFVYFKIYKILGKKNFANIDALNLLSKHKLEEICNIIGIKEFKIKKIKWLGISSNLILIIKK